MKKNPELLQIAPALEQPSSEAYNLDEVTYSDQCEHGDNTSYFSQCQQDRMLEPILRSIGKGFFVESGAVDGQKDSNTLYFELNYGWSGLLVEPNPRDFQRLKAKHRRAYTFNGCLSDDGQPKRIQFQDTSSGLGKIMMNNDNTPRFDAEARPLEALLEEAGQSTVDFWSLDIEGSEGAVLLNFDFSKIEVGVLLIEMNKNMENNNQVLDVMMKQGFLDIGHSNWDQGILDHIFINPKYFEKRNLPVPTGEDLEPQFRY